MKLSNSFKSTLWIIRTENLGENLYLQNSHYCIVEDLNLNSFVIQNDVRWSQRHRIIHVTGQAVSSQFHYSSTEGLSAVSNVGQSHCQHRKISDYISRFHKNFMERLKPDFRPISHSNEKFIINTFLCWFHNKKPHKFYSHFFQNEQRNTCRRQTEVRGAERNEIHEKQDECQWNL
jgi:hypothetical protein